MLDEKTLCVLEFLNAHPDESFSVYQMEKRGIAADYETMRWLFGHDMVYRYDDPDGFRYEYEEPEYLYKINPGGHIALAQHQRLLRAEERAENAETRAEAVRRCLA